MSKDYFKNEPNRIRKEIKKLKDTQNGLSEILTQFSIILKDIYDFESLKYNNIGDEILSKLKHSMFTFDNLDNLSDSLNIIKTDIINLIENINYNNDMKNKHRDVLKQSENILKLQNRYVQLSMEKRVKDLEDALEVLYNKVSPLKEKSSRFNMSSKRKEDTFLGVPSFKNKIYSEDIKKKIRETKKHFKNSPSLRKNVLKINALKKYGSPLNSEDVISKIEPNDSFKMIGKRKKGRFEIIEYE